MDGESTPQIQADLTEIAGSAPDHRSQARIVVKRIGIFMVGKLLPSICKKDICEAL